VFGSSRYRGNPLAAVVDSQDLDDAEMLRFANWTNLSETTFLLPPTTSEADYRVRIFTPSGELPFAGHPTLGSCRVWLDHQLNPTTRSAFVQECEAGLISLRLSSGDGPQRIAFAAPPQIRSDEPDMGTIAQLERFLRVDSSEFVACRWIDNGPGWIGVQFADAAMVLAVEPDPSEIAGPAVGLVGPHAHGHDFAYELRAFFPTDGGIAEDPRIR
jgi:PhzF family phenazine biosynthesis protein